MCSLTRCCSASAVPTAATDPREHSFGDDSRTAVRVHPLPGGRHHVGSVRPMSPTSSALKYWNVEANRYPQYDHVAVLVAEDITTAS